MAKARTANKEAEVPWIPVVVALVGAIAATAAAWITATHTAKREAAAFRVETDEVSSNSNTSDINNPWEPWEGRLTERTTMVGVQRRVRFAKPFQNPPRISTAFTLINVRSLDEVLRDLGHTPPDQTEIARLRQLHINVSSGSVKPDGFVLYVGVGLPTPSANVLIRNFQERPVDNDILTIHRRFQKLNPKSDTLTMSDRWMMNFYTLIGTLNVAWIATATEQ